LKTASVARITGSGGSIDSITISTLGTPNTVTVTLFADIINGTLRNALVAIIEREPNLTFSTITECSTVIITRVAIATASFTLVRS
jgi:hypothetical protein